MLADDGDPLESTAELQAAPGDLGPGCDPDLPAERGGGPGDLCPVLEDDVPLHRDGGLHPRAGAEHDVTVERNGLLQGLAGLDHHRLSAHHPIVGPGREDTVPGERRRGEHDGE